MAPKRKTATKSSKGAKPAETSNRVTKTAPSVPAKTAAKARTTTIAPASPPPRRSTTTRKAATRARKKLVEQSKDDDEDIAVPPVKTRAKPVKKQTKKKAPARNLIPEPPAENEDEQQDEQRGDLLAEHPDEQPAANQAEQQAGRQASVGSDASDGTAVDGWAELPYLTEVFTQVDCEYQGRKTHLRVTLQVFVDPSGFQSRLGYRARFDLADNNAQIGFVHSWRINKPTNADHQVLSSWQDEQLSADLNTIDPRLRETAICMKALFTPTGGISYAARNHEDMLQGESLIFVEMVYVFPEFQRQGFLQPLLTGYHTALKLLPEWFAFSGVLVLVPSKPDGERGQSWGKIKERQIEQILERAYTNHGRYELLV